MQHLPINLSIVHFRSNFCPYGYLDIKCALQFLFDFGKTHYDLVDAVKEFHESCDTPYDKIDPCFIAYDLVLQEARSELLEIIDFDIQNDADYHVLGNYLATCYQWCAESEKHLTTALELITKEQKQALRDSDIIPEFLRYIGLI